VSVTAYHSFGGEVEALNTPTIRRLTPSCRHQLPHIARILSAKPIDRVSAKGDTKNESIKMRSARCPVLINSSKAILRELGFFELWVRKCATVDWQSERIPHGKMLGRRG
jgi:hypothetical protein